MIPIQRTDRLILRGPEPHDLAVRGDVFAPGLDRRIRRDIGAKTVTLGDDTFVRLPAACRFPGTRPSGEFGQPVRRSLEDRGHASEAVRIGRAPVHGASGRTVAAGHDFRSNSRPMAQARGPGGVREAPAARHPDPGTSIHRHIASSEPAA